MFLSIIFAQAPTNTPLKISMILVCKTSSIVFPIIPGRLGDVNEKHCRTCVNKVIKDVQARCPYNKGAIIWYDECVLQYSDNRFFGEIDNQNTYIMLNRQNVKDPTMFDQKVATLFAELPWKVSHSATNYASGKFNLDKSKKIYWLAQCALYLSQEYCGKCIQYSILALQRVCHGRQGGYLPVTVQR
ncbi:cysteine-rich repeat secretory protein 38-like [Fagus crenata]